MQVIAGHWVRQEPGGEVPWESWGYGGGYDPAGLQLVILGNRGPHGNYVAAYDTDENRWRELSAKGKWRVQRDSAAVMFDAVERKLIIFGGQDVGRADPLGDTWEYDLEKRRWLELKPSGIQPRPRAGGVMAYDEEHRVAYMFGGSGEDSLGGSQVLGDLWAYDLGANRWTELHPAGETPAARSGHEMVFDSRANRLILLLGRGDVGDGLYGDMWSYDVGTDRWARLAPEGARPTARVSSAVYLEAENQIFLFGGLDMVSEQNDTWLYDIDRNQWVRLPDEGGDLPAPRSDHSIFLDTTRHAVILIGGADERSEVLSDVWAYGLGE